MEARHSHSSAAVAWTRLAWQLSMRPVPRRSLRNKSDTKNPALSQRRRVQYMLASTSSVEFYCMVTSRFECFQCASKYFGSLYHAADIVIKTPEPRVVFDDSLAQLNPKGGYPDGCSGHGNKVGHYKVWGICFGRYPLPMSMPMPMPMSMSNKCCLRRPL